MWVDTENALGDRHASASAPVPVHILVREHCRNQAQAVAVSFRGQSMSYGELGRRVEALATKLQQAGVGPGSSVVVCLQPSFETVVCLLGVLSSGAIYVPLDPSYPLERLTAIVDEVTPSVLLTQRGLKAQLPRIEATWFVEDLAHAPSEPFVAERAVLSSDETAYIIYTSGTTGKPKGVMVSHRNLSHHIQVSSERYGFSKTDVMPAMARSTFSITMFEMFSPLVAGGELVVLEREHVLDFKRLIETLRRSTILHASPSLLRKFVAYVKENGLDVALFDGLRHVSSGGDLVSHDLMEQLKGLFREAELYVIYGCTEISCMGCTFEITRLASVGRNYVGHPFKGVAIKLLNERMEACEPGTIGEIYFSGTGIALGYLKRDDLTQERFLWLEGQRFYRTGDLGRLDNEGRLEMLGRADFQIKLRGMRIELGEIEATLRAVSGVKECVVVAKDLGSGEPSLVAYVASDDARPGFVRQLRGICQRKLPDYMVPSVIVCLGTLPVNMNQKLDRSALPMPTLKDLEAMREYHPPTTQTERKLVEVWQRVLRVEHPIGIRDSFFDVGGSSLLTVELMTEIERVFGRTLPLSTLLTDPSVEALGAVIDARESDLRLPLVVLRDGDDTRPVFFVHDGEGETIPYLALAQRIGDGRKVYGVQPKATVAHPMLHSRLDDVAAYYTDVIRRAQPHGPYCLGGLCIGGFIALEVARRLEKANEQVQIVVLLDAAHVHATPRSRAVARASSLRRALQSETRRSSRISLAQAQNLARLVWMKGRNTVRYEIGTRLTRQKNRARMQLFRFCLDRNLQIPEALRGIPVQVILRFAEREYVQREPYRGPVILVRATQKSPIFDGTPIDDTPYVDNFLSPLLGWEGCLTQLSVFDAPGGHSSMLQDANVDFVAELVNAHLKAGAAEGHAPENMGTLSL